MIFPPFDHFVDSLVVAVPSLIDHHADCGDGVYFDDYDDDFSDDDDDDYDDEDYVNLLGYHLHPPPPMLMVMMGNWLMSVLTGKANHFGSQNYREVYEMMYAVECLFVVFWAR